MFVMSYTSHDGGGNYNAGGYQCLPAAVLQIIYDIIVIAVKNHENNQKNINSSSPHVICTCTYSGLNLNQIQLKSTHVYDIVASI